MPEPLMDEAGADEAAKRTPGNDAAGDPAEPSAIEIEVHADAEHVAGGRRRRAAADSAAETEAEAEAEPGPGLEAEPEAAADAAAEVADREESEPAEDDAPAGGPSGEEPCHRQALSARVEALLLASDRPMTEARLADICGLPRAGATARIRAALAELTEFHRASGRSFRPRKVAGGWQLVTLPAFGPLMARLHRDRQETRLSPAAMETLSIIAYRQPVLRAELEAIRGVACGEVLRSLMERRLVSIVGRSEDLGRPMLYGTTRQFLEVFGLSSLEDLPEVPGLERRRPPRPAAASPAEQAEDAVAADGVDAGDTEAPADGDGEPAVVDAGEHGDATSETATETVTAGTEPVAGATPEPGA